MSDTDDERIAELEDAVRRDDPRFAKRLGAGRPCRPREYRRWRLCLLVTFAVAATLAGAAAGQELLIAVGLILLGGSAHLWAVEPYRRRRHGGGRQ
ncbi:DUF3040 domain-containing protein [Streptomycetaceae bacterium NBC_01309]